MSYEIKHAALDVAATKARLVAEGSPMTSLLVLSIAAGTAPLLHIGSGEGIPVYGGFETDLCGQDEQLGGLFYTNAAPAAAGAEMLVLVWFSGGSSRSSS